ncbi:HNH endonuclease [Candidatus Enterococcus mangumiae]|uniref:HNH nuclease domain-containing protein n=1 Tax=Candidatus Enterococcus mangumiae TaxID=2230878 RepID=A0ABZ2SVV0_9ENTE|nr:HNH endonuclease signature motif containing protein [Enterococcus sp. DIV1094]MBO0489298.1 HNH endonuclease [Enterococcus sp. DIV1094]
MAKRSNIKTPIDDIVSYWVTKVYEGDLSVDFSEAHERCWRCGYQKKLERCHIIPHSLGGKDIPSNYVLLCKRCHIDNPNVSDPEIMWDWLKAYKADFYDTFWAFQGMIEYKKIYGISFQQELINRNIEDRIVADIFKDQFKNASIHFGNPEFNVATIAGILKMFLKEYDRQISTPTQR